MLEVPSSYLIDEKKWNRKKAAIVTAILVFIVGLPSALSYGGSEFFTNISLPTIDGGQTSNGWFGIMDYYFGSLFIVIVALATSVYVGWILNIQVVKTEIDDGSTLFSKPIYGYGLKLFLMLFPKSLHRYGTILFSIGFIKPLFGNISFAMIWKFFIRYVCPIVIALVFLDMIGIFG